MRASWIEAALIAAGAIVGWYATRRWRLSAEPAPRPPSRDYLAGLNYLVNEQPDRAVEAFLRAVAVDQDTVETQFALGALFRRRGEVDRAIRVHQNLIAREQLDPAFREQATYALAQDYQRAGLYDRAEKLLLELAEGGTYRIAALKDLVGLYEVEREWQRAIAIHRDLARIGKPDQPSAIAHYHCELAEVARAAGDTAKARELLRTARSELRRFPRAALVRADVALDLGAPEDAIRLLKKVPVQSPQLAGEVLPRLVRALKAAGREADLPAVVAELAGDGREVADALAYAAILTGALDSPALLALARGFLGREPAVAEIVGALLPEGAALEDAALVRLCAAIRRQVLRAARFRCGECGFSSSGFFWQCPGCKSWDSLKPLSPSDLGGQLASARGR
ncbi:MAG TPA: tetratricopeptide repeat protein [Steroidobacteraceae bacterium]|nr:tetratricopeptide repeat protein [Steroidobacteraceae bacterium]